MSLFEELKDLGVDVDGGLRRINKNEKLYKRLLGSFVRTIKSYYVDLNFDDSNCNDIIEKTHAIKGAAGNLSITPVYDSYNEIVNLLRSGQTEQAKLILEKILPVQKEIIECIEKYMD